MSAQENESVSKQPKIDDELNYEAIAGPSNQQAMLKSQTTSPPIFALTFDCFGEIFEYLSIEEVFSFGETCKVMQNVAGEYFKRNYFGAEKYIEKNGIHVIYYYRDNKFKINVETTYFNQYVNELSLYCDDFETLDYIKRHINEFDSVKDLNFISARIDVEKVNYFRPILSKIERIRLNECTTAGNIFRVLLQYCENLTHLTISDDFGDIIGHTNPWLLHRYTKLKYLNARPKCVNEILELGTFFERNPSVQDYTTNFLSLWANRMQFWNFNVQLDQLHVEDNDYYHTLENLDEICNLIKQLHEKGVFKRLHITFGKIDKEKCNLMAELPGFEKLTIDEYTGIYDLASLTNLRELHLPDGFTSTEIETLAINLVNLEKVTVWPSTSDELLPFMQHSIKLTKLYVYLVDGILNLAQLNAVRESIFESRKTIIYVKDNIFLPTKWATHYGNINLKLVEMRRINSSVRSELKTITENPLYYTENLIAMLEGSQNDQPKQHNRVQLQRQRQRQLQLRLHRQERQIVRIRINGDRFN